MPTRGTMVAKVTYDKEVSTVVRAPSKPVDQFTFRRDDGWELEGSKMLAATHSTALAIFGLIVLLRSFPEEDWTIKRVRDCLKSIEPRMPTVSNAVWGIISKGPFAVRPKEEGLKTVPRQVPFEIQEAAYLWCNNWEKKGRNLHLAHLIQDHATQWLKEEHDAA